MRSLTIVERALGPEHPKTALRIGNLADLLCDEGDTSGAEELYERVLSILEKHRGVARSSPLAKSLNNYLVLLQKGHRRQEAMKVQSRIRAL